MQNEESISCEALLTLRPEFRQVFMAATHDGVVGNPIADFGRSIPPKTDLPGCGYCFVDED
ncbi:hypothetical protein PRIPAC_87361 [Pristionchus pacificus]|uniref:Uncharacterized protein n=1 Tax=Pristionchus pacificus TaxID=54126 RepID=A0A454XLN7_PRIPA|nr:hypothetical protein PRIPAC_87361 [Pristionchus pacificus]|eukprot:PDM83400.1 hypothetical protein PRIPAC_35032 [Pristionchus pacificus]